MGPWFIVAYMQVQNCASFNLTMGITGEDMSILFENDTL